VSGQQTHSLTCFLRMVLRGAFSQVAIGLAIGIPAAIGAGRLMTEQLFSVSPWDPVMLASATCATNEGWMDAYP
jgi:hypothetical protein